MNLLLVSGSDVKGGAAKVAYALANGMRARGHEVTYLVGTKSSQDEFVREIPKAKRSARSWRSRALHRLGVDYCHLDSPFPHSLGADYFSQFDVIHLHDAPALNLAALPWLTRLRPVAWTMHTMGAFTGNCLYAYGCERWKSTCGNCPQFGVWPLKWLHRDGSRANLAIKRIAFGHSRLHIVGVSEWISARARESVLGMHPVTTIQNPVDTEVFRPIPKSEAKARLGIAPDRRVILFAVSGDPEDTRKGTDLIAKALRLLKTERLTLIPLGISGEAGRLAEILAGHDFLPPRHLDNDADLNLHYSAADLVWHPSRADTSSMVGLEAMASGTPVIAARVGGVPEVISAGSGRLIAPESSQQLACETDEFFSSNTQKEALDPSLARLNHAHSIKRFLNRHTVLYENISQVQNVEK